MNVEQVMTHKVFACGPNDSLAEAAGAMWNHDVGCVPVVDAESKPLAMITDRDICMCAYLTGKSLGELTVASAMSKELISCKPSDSAERAEALMRSSQIRRLPVVDEVGKLVGVVALNDLARTATHVRGRKPRTVELEDVVTTLAAVCEPRSMPQQAAA
jgi:CBS domain-containing protein